MVSPDYGTMEGTVGTEGATGATCSSRCSSTGVANVIAGAGAGAAGAGVGCTCTAGDTAIVNAVDAMGTRADAGDALPVDRR